MSPGGHQFGDTTYTKVFVGGLAWETQKDTMKKYFEQFGEILEAVVITDKATGRSKGYGFVTFKEADAAMRACVDASPVIDGRRANCNLASLGIQRSKPSTPKLGGGRNMNFRVMNSFQGGGGGGMGAAFPSAPTTFPHYAIQQGIPLPSYNLYAHAASAAALGYSAYSHDYTYPASFYGIYGGGAAQYSMYGGTGPTAFYPYVGQQVQVQVQGGEGSGGYSYSSAQSYGVQCQYPQSAHHHLYHYVNGIGTTATTATATGTGSYQHHYGTPMSLAPSLPALHSGVTMALHAPIPHR